MAVFNITISTTEAYLKAISGLTSLTPRESELLAAIINFMLLKNLTVLDEQVKYHILNTFKMNSQTYYNLISKLRKKKLLLNSHSKTQLKPLLLPGTTLEIKFQEEVTILKDFEVAVEHEQT